MKLTEGELFSIFHFRSVFQFVLNLNYLFVIFIILNYLLSILIELILFTLLNVKIVLLGKIVQIDNLRLNAYLNLEI